VPARWLRHFCRAGYEFDVGPIAIPLHRVFARVDLLAFTVTGSLTCREPLFAANTLVASSKASPSSKPLEIFDASLRSFFLSEDVGNRFWAAWTRLRRKFLRFAAEGLQCCLGVKQRGLGRKALCSLLGDCSHLGRQTECETNPFNPEKMFFSKNRVS